MRQWRGSVGYEIPYRETSAIGTGHFRQETVYGRGSSSKWLMYQLYHSMVKSTSGSEALSGTHHFDLNSLRGVGCVAN